MKVNIIDRSKSKTWPQGRSGHCMCCDENFLYLFGGYDPKHGNTVYNDLWRFNTSTNEWHKLPDPQNMAPMLCLSSSMVKCDESLFVFGGTKHPFGVENGFYLSVYSLKRYRWMDNFQRIMRDKRLLNDSRMNEIRVQSCGCYTQNDVRPSPKYGQTMVVSTNHDRLYVFAGTDGFVFNNKLHSFRLKDMCWVLHGFCEEHSLLKPTPRYRHEAVTTSSGFYVLGGGNELDQSFELNKIEYFSFNDQQWCRKQCSSTVVVPRDQSSNNVSNVSYPPSRKSHACCLHEGKVYVVGGLNNQHPLQDIWILDIKTMTWEAKNFFPYSVYFHTTVATSFGCMYVFGGVDSDAKRVSDLHYVRLSVPPLRRLAWVRCVKLIQRNGKVSKEVLIKLNIPKCFWHWIDDLSLVPGA